MIYRADLYERCKALIKDLHLTISEFCQGVGVSRETYYKWTSGKTRPKEEILNRIEEFLKINETKAINSEELKYKPISECVLLSGLAYEKIIFLCKNGILKTKKTTAGRWLVDIDDFTQYIQKDLPNRKGNPRKMEDKKLAFGALRTSLVVGWQPLLSHNKDEEIFDSEIHEYDCQYLVSSTGLIYNAATGEILAVNSERTPYIAVGLKKDGKNVMRHVHRLVAYCFCPNALRKDVVHHIDGNEHNNRADNLIYVTYAQHKKCHELMDAKRKREYKKYIRQLRKENELA